MVHVINKKKALSLPSKLVEKLVCVPIFPFCKIFIPSYTFEEGNKQPQEVQLCKSHHELRSGRSAEGQIYQHHLPSIKSSLAVSTDSTFATAKKIIWLNNNNNNIIIISINKLLFTYNTHILSHHENWSSSDLKCSSSDFTCTN